MQPEISINLTVAANAITVHPPLFDGVRIFMHKDPPGEERTAVRLNNDGRITAPDGVTFRVFEHAKGFMLHVSVALLVNRPIQSYEITVTARHPCRFCVTFDDGANGRFVSWARVPTFEDDAGVDCDQNGRKPDATAAPICAEPIVGDGEQVFIIALPRPFSLDAA